jgi:low affinity Fe/Cu permease
MESNHLIVNSVFRRLAQSVSVLVGSPAAFLLAILLVLCWAITGPVFGFSDTWQLVINTGTTIVTFLMVFLIQNTQNRDGRALQMKLDELILFTKGADNGFIELENLNDEQLDALEAKFHRLAKTLGHDEVIGSEDLGGPHGRRRAGRRRSARTAGNGRKPGRASKKVDHSAASKSRVQRRD